MEFDKITINKTRKLLIANKNGITLNLNGEIDHKKRGYYVSVTNNKFNNLNFLDIYKLMSKAFLYQKTNKIKSFIGGWYSANSKKWYIDITLYFRNKQEALKIAKSKNQEAIFNIKKLESIYLN